MSLDAIFQQIAYQIDTGATTLTIDHVLQLKTIQKTPGVPLSQQFSVAEMPALAPSPEAVGQPAELLDQLAAVVLGNQFFSVQVASQQGQSRPVVSTCAAQILHTLMEVRRRSVPERLCDFFGAARGGEAEALRAEVRELRETLEMTQEQVDQLIAENDELQAQVSLVV
eukprot:EST43370.1 Hypothetical protein SS50377_17050 [Spironucleus salmonicida]